MIGHLAVSFVLSPLLFVQGKWVRLRVPTLPEPPGERAGEAGEGPLLRLLVIGDSAGAGVGASHQDDALLGQLVSRLRTSFRVRWRLLAKSGATTADTLGRLHELEGVTFDAAVTSLGVNDVIKRSRRADWRERQAVLRQRLRGDHGVETLLVSGLPPVHLFPALPQPLRWAIGARATDFDRDLRVDVESDLDAEFIDLRFTMDQRLMATDGFHPGPAIYSKWAELAAAKLRAQRSR